jgi:hypothetical protein
VAQRCLTRALESGDAPDSPRVRRLQSIILTCNAAEAVMTFVIGLARSGVPQQYGKVIRGMPKALDLLVAGSTAARGAMKRVRSTMSGRKSS